MKELVRAHEELRNALTLKATNKFIRCASTNGYVRKVTGRGDSEDGWNPTTVILEELHALPVDVYEVLNSATGARSGQLIFQITTAGRVPAGHAWTARSTAIKNLEGTVRDDRRFALIFTVDKPDLEERDKLFTETKFWIKANPMYGVSVDPDDIANKAKQAITDPTKRAEFLRTRLNIWNNLSEKLIDMDCYDDCFEEGLSEDQFAGQQCTIGVDVSLTKDFTCRVMRFVRADGKFAYFGKFWLPSDSPTLQSPDLRGALMDWVKAGILELTGPGDVDQSAVYDQIKRDAAKFKVTRVGCDPALANWLMTELAKEGIEVVKYLNRPVYMTRPVEHLMATVRALQVVHDNNPLLRFCFANVEAEQKRDDGLMPIKDDKNSDNKIDGFVAAAMAAGVALNIATEVPKVKPNPYNQRGGSLYGWPTVIEGGKGEPENELNG
jgi:phage terminase large subunit-like protein